MTSLPTIPDEYREKAGRLVYGLLGYFSNLVDRQLREEDIMSIARALVEERHCQGWQDISTAPENTSILVHIPHLDYYGNKGVYAAMLVNMGTGKRWMTFGHAIGRDLGRDDVPTEWMPMPSPTHPTHSAAAPLEAR